MVLLEARPQPAQDLDRFRHRGLDDVDLLEAARERVVLLEDAAVFLVSRRADAAQLAVGERGLDQVRRVHHAARCSARADYGVDLVDEQDRTLKLLDLRQHGLEALLEVTAVLGAGDQRAEIECVDGAAREHARHLALDDQPREALDERGLAHARLADIERIVLAAPAQDLDRPFDLELTSDQRVDATFLRKLVEVRGVLLERRAALRLALAFGGGRILAAPLAFLARLRQAVADVVDHVEPRDVLESEQIGSVRVLLAEDRHQHVRDRDFLLAARLDVENRTLQHALEAERRLNLALVVLLQAGGGLLDELLEFLAEPRGVGAAGAQDLADLGSVDDGEQQVLDRHEIG